MEDTDQKLQGEIAEGYRVSYALVARVTSFEPNAKVSDKDLLCAWCKKSVERIGKEKLDKHLSLHAYYDQVHERLAKKYDTTPRVISSIRGLAGHGFTQKKQLDWLIEKLQRKKSPEKIKNLKEVLLFIGGIPEKDFVEICNFELYDKPGK